ncbi:modification methylase [Prevotella intermedia ZT]|jgi:hypothetical protein|uniref:Modification methylase n=1 Tax=Prevotella intermedia ZT TaxID=1347790 RepID=A0AAP0VDS4_PREIN|nr:adenine-specific methyltransferase EcoRI family protein [Prevotella intermedia]KJJ88146.1 modification methylase [Prevotella intermedia ZT]
MTNNTNLQRAKQKKDDEFYTRLEDIEKELSHYVQHLKGKVIYCNADGEESNFWKYFTSNFQTLQIKKVIATSYNSAGNGEMLEYDGKQVIKKSLVGNGSFNSQECKAILEQSDIIITNPPFSLFRHYIDTIKDKDFLVIGSINAVAYNNVFKLFQDDKIVLGYNNVKYFITSDDTVRQVNSCAWFTTLPVVKPELVLTKKYNATDYPTYDNYPAINVNKVADIPKDYTGAMGVPITFLTKYSNNNKFRLLDQTSPYINGKKQYKRVIIQHRTNDNN